jgi:hypothetical protein
MKTMFYNFKILKFYRIISLMILLILINGISIAQNNTDTTFYSYREKSSDTGYCDKKRERISIIPTGGIVLVDYQAGNNSSYNGCYIGFGLDVPTGKNWSFQFKINGERRYFKQDSNEVGNMYELLVMTSYKWNMNKLFFRTSFGLGFGLRTFLRVGGGHDDLYLNLAFAIGYNINRNIGFSLGCRRIIWGWSELGGNFFDVGFEIKI